MTILPRDLYGEVIRPGDLVISRTNDHSTARYGRKFLVKDLYFTRKGWRFKTDHPNPRFGETSYYLNKFALWKAGDLTNREGYFPPTKEKDTMYIAIDAGIKDPGNLTSDHLRKGTYIAIDTSMDLGLKQQVEHYLETVDPNATVFVFRLDKIVQTERVPILWRNMA